MVALWVIVVIAKQPTETERSTNNLLNKLETIATHLSRIIALIGLAGLLVIAGATVLDVLLRWIFNSPIIGLRDSYSLFISVIIASSFALCIAERNNITIRFLGNVLGPRASKSLDAFGNGVSLIFFIALSWQVWKFANQIEIDHETTWALNWPVAPWWRIVSLLIILCIPVQAVVFLQFAKSAIKWKRLSNESIATATNNIEDS